MTITFSKHPGPRERHLKRKYQNPLFGSDQPPFTQNQIQQAHQADEQELNHFLRYFRDLVQEAIDLKPESDSEVILDIKERLDKCYAHCCALPGEQSDIKNAVNTLIEVIMKAVRQGAANDPIALNTLEDEDIARRMHNELHEFQIVADLLLPDSPVESNELTATLLSEQEASLTAALQIFDKQQLQQIYSEAEALSNSLEPEERNQNTIQNKIHIIKSALL